MEQYQNTEANYWGYLIRPDRTAAPLLEQLCIGLSKIIRDLEPGPDEDLTPQRLAAFYRSVGGNYDNLLISTSSSTLSFMFMTLGCFHSLQPTTSPFESPSIPCLTSAGFARWQTLQLLLSPEDNVRFLQKAVQIYDVPRPDGGYFPKYIPKTAFPDKPDEEMERWHKFVTRQLNTNQDNYMRRIKSSPHQSPYPESHDKRDGYFSTNGRPQRSSRSSPSEEDRARIAADRRRSSVPDIIVPKSPFGEKESHRNRDNRHKKTTRSHSAQRPVQQLHTRQRSHTATASPQRTQPVSNHRPGYIPTLPNITTTSSSQRYGNSPKNSTEVRPVSSSQANHSYHKSRSGSGRRHSSSPEEDAISDESLGTSPKNHRRNQRKSDEEQQPQQQTRRSSLWLPSYLQSHKRRHSSDAAYRTSSNNGGVTKSNPALLRPDHNYHYNQPTTSSSTTNPKSPISPSVQAAGHRNISSGVRFRDDMFNNTTGKSSSTISSAPGTPIQKPQYPNDLQSPTSAFAQVPPTIRYQVPPPATSSSQHQQSPLTSEKTPIHSSIPASSAGYATRVAPVINDHSSNQNRHAPRVPPVIHDQNPNRNSDNNTHYTWDRQQPYQRSSHSNNNHHSHHQHEHHHHHQQQQQQQQQQRKAGFPTRVSTVTGVGGRKYAANTEHAADRSSSSKTRGSVPLPL